MHPPLVKWVPSVEAVWFMCWFWQRWTIFDPEARSISKETKDFWSYTVLLRALQEDVFALNQQQSELESLLEVASGHGLAVPFSHWIHLMRRTWEAGRNSLFESCESWSSGRWGFQDRNNEIKLLMYRLQDSCLRRSLTISFQICIDLSPELVRQKMARCGNIGEEVRTVPGVDLSRWSLLRIAGAIVSLCAAQGWCRLAEYSFVQWIGYGSIPINTIFRGMNIHKSQLFWCEQKGYTVLTHCQSWKPKWKMTSLDELLHLIGMSWPKATDMILGRWINGYRWGGLVGAGELERY